MRDGHVLLESNRDYAGGFREGGPSPAPATKVAVIACMDARIVRRILGLEEGS